MQSQLSQGPHSDKEAVPHTKKNVRVVHVCSMHVIDDRRVFQRDCVSLAKAGFEVHLIAAGEQPGDMFIKGVHVHAVEQIREARKRVKRRHQIARMAAALNPDIYHVHEPELLGPTIAVAKGKPVIWDVHEAYMLAASTRTWIPRPLRLLVRTLWDLTERKALKKVAAVLPATDPVAERYRPLHPNVVTIWNFPELSDMQHDPNVVRDGITCNYMGSIDFERGLPEIMRAISILHREGVPVRLDVAVNASENQMGPLMEIARQEGGEAAINMVGRLNRNDAAALADKANVGLVTNIPTERMKVGLSVKMLEYMALEVPVVYSDIPLSRMMDGGRGVGLCVNPEDPADIARGIRYILEHPEEARKMGQAGRRAVEEELNWGVMATRLIAVYEDILAKHLPERKK